MKNKEQIADNVYTSYTCGYLHDLYKSLGHVQIKREIAYPEIYNKINIMFNIIPK